MKSFLVTCALASVSLAHAAPPQPQVQSQPAGSLRQLLQQYHSGAAAVRPAPRQLSAGERAVLRRQIADTARPVKQRTKP